MCRDYIFLGNSKIPQPSGLNSGKVAAGLMSIAAGSAPAAVRTAVAAALASGAAATPVVNTVKDEPFSSDPDYVQMINKCVPILNTMKHETAQHEKNRTRDISEVIIHDTGSGTTQFRNTLRYFSRNSDGRSIHYLIGREHGEFYGMVPEEKQASHAGNSTGRNRDGISHNPQSVGIELWRHEDFTGDFTDFQYNALSALLFDILTRRKLERKDIISHGSFRRGKEGEPHGFDWARLDDLLDTINKNARYRFPDLALK